MADRASAYAALRDAECDPAVAEHINALAISYQGLSDLHSRGAQSSTPDLPIAELMPEDAA
jgi:hypothetical protein